MGIQNLNKIIQQKCPHVIKQLNLAQLRNKIIAIDANIFMYKYKYYNGNLIDHFEQQILHLLSFGIIPIYVFDGIPSQAKKNTINKRKQQKMEKLKKIQCLEKNIAELQQSHTEICNYDYGAKLQDSQEIILNDDEEKYNNNDKEIEIIKTQIQQIKRSVICVHKQDYQNIKKLLNKYNVEYHQSIGESDFVIANWYKTGKIDYVITEDFDYLPLGLNNVLYKYNYLKNHVKQYNSTTIIQALKFDFKQFVDLCILLGCDYSGKIKGIGIKRAYEYIHRYKTIESIINLIHTNPLFYRYKIPSNFDYKIARSIFICSNST